MLVADIVSIGPKEELEYHVRIYAPNMEYDKVLRVLTLKWEDGNMRFADVRIESVGCSSITFLGIEGTNLPAFRKIVLSF